MKDELKIFAEKNRESFEIHKLNLDDAWKDIEHKLDEQVTNTIKIPWGTILKVAAVFFIVMAAGIGFYLNNQRISLDRNGIALHNISAELADTEAFYATQISEKIKLIEYATGTVDPLVLSQLQLLDDDYSSLKNDLKDNADNEEVINAMIEYYRLKLSMLETILDEIQKNDDKNHEKAFEI
jgi:hypothetical protein